jgi:hypothetical protein
MLESSGRLIYRRRFAVLAAWLIVVLVVLSFAPQAPSQLKLGGFTTPELPSFVARSVLRDRLEISNSCQPVDRAVEGPRQMREVLRVRTHSTDPVIRKRVPWPFDELRMASIRLNPPRGCPEGRQLHSLVRMGNDNSTDPLSG